MSMADENICTFFKFGHCKFGDKCCKRHIKEVCEGKCNVETCQLRHPTVCKYFLRYKRCKFGDYCSFLHGEEKEECENKEIHDEINKLKEKIENFEKVIADQNVKIINMEILIKEITWKSNENGTKIVLKKSDSLENEMEVEETVVEILDSLENEKEMENITSNENNFKCVQCGFVSLRRNGLKIHMGKVHKTLIQLDGNTSLEEENLPSRTNRYWSTGVMGVMFHIYSDVLEEIRDSELEEETKIKETEIAKKSRLDSCLAIGMPQSSCTF